MQEVNDSLFLVVGSQYFWWYMGGILSTGLIIGVKYDDQFRGFRKSLSIIAPYTSIIFLTNMSRMYETSQTKALTATAYNSMWSLLIITIFYVLGLFIGHMIDQRAKVKAHEEAKVEEKKIEEATMSENVIEIKSDVKEILDK
jgi:hypothetical protein